jgi:hypothetical protein
VLLELPKIAKMQAHTIPNGPIVVFAFNRIVERAALRMALDAHVIGIDIVHLRRIDDIATGGMRRVFASRSVAAFTPDVPLRDLFGPDVVIHRMAAIAGWTRRALHIIGGDKTAPTNPFPWPQNTDARHDA